MVLLPSDSLEGLRWCPRVLRSSLAGLTLLLVVLEWRPAKSSRVGAIGGDTLMLKLEEGMMKRATAAGAESLDDRMSAIVEECIKSIPRRGLSYLFIAYVE